MRWVYSHNVENNEWFKDLLKGFNKINHTFHEYAKSVKII